MKAIITVHKVETLATTENVISILYSTPLETDKSQKVGYIWNYPATKKFVAKFKEDAQLIVEIHKKFFENVERDYIYPTGVMFLGLGKSRQSQVNKYTIERARILKRFKKQLHELDLKSIEKTKKEE